MRRESKVSIANAAVALRRRSSIFSSREAEKTGSGRAMPHVQAAEIVNTTRWVRTDTGRVSRGCRPRSTVLAVDGPGLNRQCRGIMPDVPAPSIAVPHAAVLDVREPEPLAPGHLAGSGHIPASDPAERRPELPPRPHPWVGDAPPGPARP